MIFKLNQIYFKTDLKSNHLSIQSKNYFISRTVLLNFASKISHIFSLHNHDFSLIIHHTPQIGSINFNFKTIIHRHKTDQSHSAYLKIIIKCQILSHFKAKAENDRVQFDIGEIYKL